MKPVTWRAILLALCAAGSLLVVTAFLDQLGIGGSPAWYGVWGGYFSGSAQPYHLSLRGIDLEGPAARAGVREGELVDIRPNTVRERLSFMGQGQAGRPVTLHVTRGDVHSQIAVVPGPFSLSRFWQYAVWDVLTLWLLLFAALILSRRPYADGNLLLSSVLVFAAIGVAASPLLFAWPSAPPYAAIAVAGQAGPVAVALWAILASSFARPLSPLRRIALVVSYGLIAVSVVAGSGTPDHTLGLAPLIGTLTLWFDPTRFIGAAWAVWNEAAIVSAVVCSILALIATRGIERQRAGWLLIPLAVYFCTLEGSLLAVHFLSYAAILAIAQVFSLVSIITPVVLTYAALNRRLIDIGFVLNRTVVFAVVSTIVVGVFVLVEWAAGAWLVNQSHTTSAIVGMVVALVLGFSVRYIHRYVDGIVDRMMFRKRYDDETALRRFAHESSYISDRTALLERSLQTVCAHTTADSANIFARNASGTYVSASEGAGASIDENDPAIVALNAWHKPIDLHDLAGSKLCGELAFPMTSRGRLIGVLVCGPKRDGESYAPDETDALLALAHGVGGALDVLDARAEPSSDAMLHELCASIRSLSEITRQLPDALADRLANQLK